MDLTMADMLRTMDFKVKNNKEDTWRIEVDIALQSVAWAMRSTVSALTKYTPANLAFGRDMILNDEITVNWKAIQHRRKRRAINDNNRENSKRRDFNYEVGQK